MSATCERAPQSSVRISRGSDVWASRPGQGDCVKSFWCHSRGARPSEGQLRWLRRHFQPLRGDRLSRVLGGPRAARDPTTSSWRTRSMPWARGPGPSFSIRPEVKWAVAPRRRAKRSKTLPKSALRSCVHPKKHLKTMLTRRFQPLTARFAVRPRLRQAVGPEPRARGARHARRAALRRQRPAAAHHRALADAAEPAGARAGAPAGGECGGYSTAGPGLPGGTSAGLSRRIHEIHAF